MFTLFNHILSIVVNILTTLVKIPEWEMILYLVMLVPGIAVTVKRMWDIRKSRWFFLVPIYGPLIGLFKKGDISANKYGPSTDSIESGENDNQR